MDTADWTGRLRRRLARARTWLRGERGRMFTFDAVLALIFVGLSIASTVGSRDSYNPGLLFQYPNAVMVAWGLPAVVPLALRRIRPEPAAWWYVGLTASHLLFGPGTIDSDPLSLLMLYSVLVYGTAGHAWRFVTAAMVMALLTAGVWAVTFNVTPLFDVLANGTYADWTAQLSGDTCPGVAGTLSPSTGTCGARMLQDAGILAVLIGVSMLSISVMALWQRARRATVNAMRERNASIMAREAEETRIAALAERARIARDMHDVVAHTLSTIIVQSDGGRYAGARDLALARRTMATIRHEAERAQHDMRRLFSVFGPNGAGGASGYADIPSLFDGSIPVERRVTGVAHAARLSAKADEAVFRLVQESLTNTRKHAGPGARVTIDEIWSDDALSITIADNGRGGTSTQDGHRPGYGLIGMHERIEAVGGSVTAGPRPNGGFIVAATIPLVPVPGEADGHTAMPAVPRADDAATPQASGTGHRANGESMSSPMAAIPAAGNLGPSRDGKSIPSDGMAADAGTRRASMTELPSGNPPAGSASGIASPASSASPTPILSHMKIHLPQPLYRLARWLRAKPIDQGDNHELNWVAWLARWTERHYLFMDTMGAVLLMLLFYKPTFRDLQWQTGYGVVLPHVATALLTIVLLAPLAFRRRFPEASALAVAVLAFLQLLFLPSVLPLNIFALVSVYSAVLYGRERAWRWVSVALVIDSWAFGIRTTSGQDGIGSLMRLALSPVYTVMDWVAVVLGGLLLGGMVMLAGFGCIAAARWARSRGSNALVLQQREEALRAEQERQKVLAANLERERISAAMQAEVAATLESVIVQTDAGLAMLDGPAEPSGEQVAAAFAAIGSRGRSALAHMRQLLAVLRETGFSDAAHEGMAPEMRLAPAASLDSQLRDRARG
ncbi:histidine kinase [Bifidobacterium sp. UTBIF-78]|uniref:sensor histidine kinase n=1 Tax=Bifidobacterium sp. UTBIF-78 TaxID=1465263 RepID=UPI002158A5E6|nr:histidine kinase [Bifidobacterium sp. UTBIF-78]